MGADSPEEYEGRHRYGELFNRPLSGGHEEWDEGRMVAMMRFEDVRSWRKERGIAIDKRNGGLQKEGLVSGG